MNQSTLPQPVFESFLDEHRELMQQVSELRIWCDEVAQMGDGPKYEEFGFRLQELRDVLAAHMADEERNGYLAPALEVAPRFARQAEELLEQHQEFLERIDALIDALRREGARFSGWHEAHAEFENFVLDLRKHEGAENSIIQSSFGDDMGAGD